MQRPACKGNRGAIGLAVAIGVGLTSSAPATAGEGVVEINQVAAIAGGITACDTPGFPVQICASGAYRLTSNLDYAGSDLMLLLTASDVSIDLNGMTVSGPAVCSLTPSGYFDGCATPLGSDLVLVNSGSVRATIHDGTIRGGSGACLSAFSSGLILRDLVISECNGSGVVTHGYPATFQRVRVTTTRLLGLSAGGEYCDVRDVTVTGAGNAGMFFGRGSLVEHAVATRNLGAGISLDVGSVLRGFASTQNGLEGVVVMDGGLVESGAIRSNGVVDGTRFGLNGQGGAAFREVVVTSTTGGNTSTTTGLVNLGNNTCQGVSCPP